MHKRAFGSERRRTATWRARYRNALTAIPLRWSEIAFALMRARKIVRGLKEGLS